MQDFFIEIFNSKIDSKNVYPNNYNLIEFEGIKIAYPKEQISFLKKNDNIILSCITEKDKANLLKKYNFLYNKNTDSEILFELYKNYKNKSFEFFSNKFLFFKFNLNSKNFIIARDKIGFNSVYYLQKNESIIISSHIKSILDNANSQLQVNKGMVAKFLKLNPFSDHETFFKDVFKVSPSSYLFKKNNYLGQNKYKRFSKTEFKNSKLEQISGLKKTLRNAILRKDEDKNEKIGFLFSGGLDSSTIISFYNKFNFSKKDLFAYSATYSHLKKSILRQVDEEEFQKEITNNANIIDRSFKTKNLSTLSKLDFFLKIIGQPFIFPNLYICDEAFQNARNDNVKKMFNGSDGDTVISHGYEYFGELFLTLRWIKLYYSIKKLSENLNLSKKDIFRRAVLNLIFYNKKIYFSAKEKHKAILSSPIHSYAIEIQSVIANYHGIDEVYPFYDMDVINFCTNVNPKFKIDKFTRSILREVVKGIVPEKIRKRTDKANIGHALVHNFLNRDKEIIEKNIQNPHEIINEITDISKIRDSWSKFLINPHKYSGSDNTVLKIFAFVVMNRWLEINTIKNT